MSRRIFLNLSDADQLTEEIFGPVLHVVRYAADQLDRVLQSIERSGYGLTLGIHSRIDDTVEAVIERLAVGNIYVNRNMIGAVVGVQPFGGHGLSGTGPKAGGPHYLRALRDRTDRDREYRGGRRQCRADVGWGVNRRHCDDPVSSFRGDAKHRTRITRIPRCAIAHLRSGPSATRMTFHPLHHHPTWVKWPFIPIVRQR